MKLETVISVTSMQFKTKTIVTKVVVEQTDLVLYRKL